MHDSHDHSISVATKKAKEEKSSMIADNLVFKLTIPWNEAHQAYKKALQKESKKIKTGGFRKGKVPTHLAEKHIGKESLVYEAINSLIPAKYTEAIEKSKKQIVAYPDFVPVSLEWEKEWVIEAHTAERPEVKLGDYKKIIKNAGKEAEKEIAKLEKEVEKSKKATKKDDKSKEKTPKLPPMTDQAKKDKKLETIIKTLVTEVKPAIPEILIKQQAHQELHRLEEQLGQLNLDIEQYLSRRGATQESLMQELATSALAQLQTDFVLQAITIEEKLDATEAEITKQLGDKAKSADAQLLSMVKTSIQRQKLLEFLLA